MDEARANGRLNGEEAPGQVHVGACLFFSDYRKCKKLSGRLKRMSLSLVCVSAQYIAFPIITLN